MASTEPGVHISQPSLLGTSIFSIQIRQKYLEMNSSEVYASISEKFASEKLCCKNTTT